MTAAAPEPRADAPPLRDLQRWMRWIVCDPRGVGPALAEPRPEGLHPLHRYRSPAPGGADWIAAGSPQERVARLDVYAEGYFARIAEALAEDFPNLHEVLGAQGFAKLVADYLKAWPARSWTLAEAGRGLAGFLAGHELMGEAPWLADLARWEWAMVLAFHADDGPALDVQALGTVAESAWAEARIALHPSVQLLSLDWPVPRLRDAIQEGTLAAIADTPPLRTHVAVWRQEGQAVSAELEPGAMHLLRRLGEQIPLAQVCEEATEVLADGTAQAAAERLMAWFAEWAGAGLFARIAFGDSAARHTKA